MMDEDKTTEDILTRTRRRNREIEQLLSGPENEFRPSSEKSNAEKSAEQKYSDPTDFPSESPLTPITNLAPMQSENSSPTKRHSRFAQLAADVDKFEFDYKPNFARSKEELLKGPPKRVSMGGETRPSVLFTPSGYTTVENKSPRKQGEDMPSTKPNTCPNDTKEQNLEHGKMSNIDSVIVEEWDESPKTKGTDNIILRSETGPNKTERRSRFAALSAHLDEFECEIKTDKTSPVKKSALFSETKNIPFVDHEASPDVHNSSSEYGIHTFGEKSLLGPVHGETCKAPAINSPTKYVWKKANGGNYNMKEGNIKPHLPMHEEATLHEEKLDAEKQITPQPITPKSNINLSQSNTTQSPGDHNTSPRSAIVKTPLSSVKALRNRWEVSSATGTPLHPNKDNDELLDAAMRMVKSAERPKKPFKRNFKGADVPGEFFNQGSTPDNPEKASNFASHNTEENDISPKKQLKTSSTLKPTHASNGNNETAADVIDQAFDFIPNESQTTPIKPTDSDNLNKSPCPKTGPFRAVTPNSEIVGSLMEAINEDFEKNYTPKSRRVAKQVYLGEDESDSRPLDKNSLTHTISFYRRQGTLARKPQIDFNTVDEDKTNNEANSEISEDQADSNVPPIAPTNEATLKRLHEAIIVQQDQICQASRALAFCRQNNHFRAGREEVDAQRALLIATERRRAYVLERDRLINSKGPLSSTRPSEPRGTLTFSYIAVKLSRDYINMYVRSHSECHHYYFIVLIKSGENVVHTSLASSNQGVKSGFVEFSHYIQLGGLTTDFVCTVEIYSLRTAFDENAHDKVKKQSTWKRMVTTPISGGLLSHSAGSATLPGSSSRPVQVIDPGFQKVGYTTLNRSLLGKQKFHLTDVMEPLDGNLVLNMRCFAEEEVVPLNMRAFISLYQIVSGLGAWTRFWCVLRNGQMRFWRYLEDEEKKSPCVTLDLSKCLSKVSEVSSSVASLPHSMQVDIALGEDDMPKEEIRLLLAAESHEVKLQWMEAINTAIRNANLWGNPSQK